MWPVAAFVDLELKQETKTNLMILRQELKKIMGKVTQRWISSSIIYHLYPLFNLNLIHRMNAQIYSKRGLKSLTTSENKWTEIS